MRAIKRIQRYGTKAYAKTCLHKEWSPELHKELEEKYKREFTEDKTIPYYQAFLKFKDIYGKENEIFSRPYKTKKKAKNAVIKKAKKSPEKFHRLIKTTYKTVRKVIAPPIKKETKEKPKKKVTISRTALIKEMKEAGMSAKEIGEVLITMLLKVGATPEEIKRSLL
jgi:hypothetical protein